MGCGQSSEAAPPHHNNGKKAAAAGGGTKYNTTTEDPQEVLKSSGIDRDLEHNKRQEDLKVKLLLLGAGESGKSTIFKQMRILYGAPRSEDDMRMYGVVVRSNIITAMRKLCTLLRNLNLEDQLSSEVGAAENGGGQSGCMTPKMAYDVIVAHLIEGTASSDDLPEPNMDKDWVGISPRAGPGANNDAKIFLQLCPYIKTLWEVREEKRAVWQANRYYCQMKGFLT
jgi:G-protein alpha subunit